MTSISKLLQRTPLMLALVALILAMGGSWTTSATAAPTLVAKSTSPPPSADDGNAARGQPVKKAPSGRINLNTATEEQLMLLPTVGPAKAERIVSWRKKNGGFRRVADLRRVKGFGYKTFKRLEPLLDVKGDTTLAQK
jgi:competence protein ComEA